MSTDFPTTPNSPGYNNGSTPAEDYRYLPGPSGPLDYATQPEAGPWQSDGSEGGGSGLKRYFAALWRFKWLFPVAIVVGGGVGYFLSKRVELEYMVESTVWIDRSNSDKGPIAEGKLFDAGAWLDLLKSFAVLDYVVVQEKLFLQHDGGNAGLYAGLSLKDKFRTGEYRVSLSRNRSKVILENRAGVVDSAAIGDSLGLKAGLAWV